MFKKLVVTLALLVLLKAVVLLLLLWPVLAGKPNVATDYAAQLHAMALERTGVAPTESDAAWEALTDLLLRFDEVSSALRDAEFRDAGDDEFADFARVRCGNSIPSGLDREMREIAAHRQAGIIDEFGIVAAGPIGLRPPGPNDEPLTFRFRTGLATSRSLAKMRAAMMRLAANAGDEEAVVAAFGETLYLSRTFLSHAGPIDQLIGMAITALTVAEIELLVREYRFSPETCARLLARLDEVVVPDVDLVLAGNRADVLDTIQRMFSDDGNGDGYAVPGDQAGAMIDHDMWSVQSVFNSRFRFGTRREHVDELDALTALFRREAGLLKRDRWQAGQPAAVHVLAEAFARIVPKLLTTRDYSAQRIDAARVIIAVELFRARENRLPATLAEVSDLVGGTPTDAVSGAPFGYELDAANGTYVLYSYGPDGVDDGDRTAVTPDAPPGTDYVITREREACED